jgi:hypothetical protein
MRRVARRLTLWIFIAGVPVLILGFLLGRFIPPVSGRVVDAATGKGVRGVDVVLEACQWTGGPTCVDIRGRTTTGPFGWFFLPGAVAWNLNVLGGFGTSWLAVNEGGGGILEEDGGSSGNIIRYNPLFNHPGWPVGNTKYFPTTVMFDRKGCARAWKAACQYHLIRWGVSIPLMPALDNLDDCAKLRDVSLQENCRQLTTYRAALVHVDSYEEVQKDRDLCNSVDGGDVSKDCLRLLAGHSGGNPAKPLVPEPIPDGMFPDSIAGVPVMKNKHCGPRLLFNGMVTCAAGYGSDRLMKRFAFVYIEEWPGAGKPGAPADWAPHYNDHARAAVSAEIWPGGGKLLHYSGQYQSFDWYSGDWHVEVVVYRPFSGQNKFVSYYMQRYPSRSPN